MADLKHIDPDLFDLAASLEHLEGDRELLEELAELFLEDCPGMMADIEQAVAAGDADAIRRAAHTMKGSVSNLGSRSVAEAARELEYFGRDGKLDETPGAFAHLQLELGKLEGVLRELA